MSMPPFLFNSRPTRILDQHFGLSLNPEDIFEPLTLPKSAYRQHPQYLRSWRSHASQQDRGSTIEYGKDKFNVILDVQQFEPQEITVNVTGENTITVEGHHEEKEDEHGFISRKFVRRYVLPKNYDISKVESKLSLDGVLSISAPNTQTGKVGHREIPVIETGVPLENEEKIAVEEIKVVEEKIEVQEKTVEKKVEKKVK